MRTASSVAVAPEDSKGRERVVNLYEVLDDRFAQEGCCRFLFFVCFFFFVCHFSMSASYYADVAGEKSNFKDKLIVPSDQFERKQFNAWGLQLMRALANDQKYFGDKLEVMRVHAQLHTILCNYTEQHPKGAGNTPSDGNRAPQSSLAKTYENVCPVLSGVIGKGNEHKKLTSLMQTK